MNKNGFITIPNTPNNKMEIPWYLRSGRPVSQELIDRARAERAKAVVEQKRLAQIQDKQKSVEVQTNYIGFFVVRDDMKDPRKSCLVKPTIPQPKPIIKNTIKVDKEVQYEFAKADKEVQCELPKLKID